MPHTLSSKTPLKTLRNRVSNFLARVLLAVVAMVIIICIAPYTMLTTLLEPIYASASLAARNLRGSTNWGHVIYDVGYVLLCTTLCAYIGTRLRAKAYLPSLQLSDAIACFAVLFLLDPLFSVIGTTGIGNRWWPLYLFATFFIIVVCAGERHAWSLIYLVLFAIGVQSLYAIAFYYLGIQQFHGARFGNRTGGTFNSPNALYPLCLLAIPLNLAMSQKSASHEWRFGWYSLTFLSAFALLLTFTRGAWLAVLMPLAYFTFSRRSPFSSHRIWRTSAITFIGILMLSVLFLRTRGNLIGGYSDSSFWGRIYIWKVAVNVIADRPVFGSGVSSYYVRQNQFMTPRLQLFHPDNVEAKQLYLNVAVELGLVGLGVLLWTGWKILKVYHSSKSAPSCQATSLLNGGVFCAIVSVAVAGLTDTPILNSDRIPPTLALLVLLACFCVINRPPVLGRELQGSHDNSS